jgi:hypothetical protein
MRFRQSTLKTWCACPLQAKFRHIDHEPHLQSAKASFGTCIHFALAHYNETGDIETAIELFEHYWHNPEELGVEPQVWPKFITFDGLRTKGLEILRDYDDKLKWEDRRVITTEHRFLVPFGEYELEGTLDLLELRRNYRGNDIMRVVDYKTNTTKPRKAQLFVDIQFTVYSFASMQREFWVGNGDEFPPIDNGEYLFDCFKDLERRAIWYHLWTGSDMDAGTRDEPDFMRLYRVCQEIEKAVAADVYVPNISGESCTFCDYANGPCPVTIPTAEELREDEAAWV